MKTLQDFDFIDKRIILRADLDVPLDNGKIVDDFRLRTALATIKVILKQCRQLIIIGHAGRPNGPDSKLSLKSVAERFQALLGDEITFLDDCVQESLPDSNIILLENLRFHKEEEENNEEFAKKLASYADIYVNEAFAVSHREHASIVGIPKHLPGCIGYQFEKELKFLKIENPERPFVAIIGGAKLETKLPCIAHLLGKVDNILLGGAMIFTFYKAKGYDVGKSLIDERRVADAKTLLNDPKLILPKDVMIADNPESKEARVVQADKIPSDKIGLDIGPASIEEFKQILNRARVIVWNGPLGYYENEVFAKATKDIAEALANLQPACTIIGGGDTAAVVDKLGIADKFTHVSTGGGSSLRLLGGKSLPGLDALK